MNPFKTIVVATDFSKNAKYAYKYALDLAKAINAKLKLVHVYSVPVDLNRDGYPVFTPNFEKLSKKVEADLKKFASNEEVECIAYPGFAGELLVDLSKKADCDLLIVGAKGETGLVTKLFGGIAALAMHKAFCPVMVVPPKVKFLGINNIIYTLSKESANADFLKVAGKLADKLNGKLHLVHVNNGGSSEMPEVRYIIKMLDLSCEIADLDFVSTRGGIDVYREKHKAELIIAVTHHYAFWENFTHASVTDSLVWNTETPILVLHREDKGS